jgi:hypothetical protein
MHICDMRGHCVELIPIPNTLANACVGSPVMDNSPAHTTRVCTVPTGFVNYPHLILTPYALKTLTGFQHFGCLI